MAPAFKSISFICRPARWYRALDSPLRKLHNLWPCSSRCYPARSLPQRDLFYLTPDVDCRRGCHSLSDYSYVSIPLSAAMFRQLLVIYIYIKRIYNVPFFPNIIYYKKVECWRYFATNICFPSIVLSIFRKILFLSTWKRNFSLN